MTNNVTIQGLDARVLHACLTKRYYIICKPFLKAGILEPQAMDVLKVYARYYKQYKSVDIINKQDLLDFINILPEGKLRTNAELFIPTIKDTVNINDDFLKETLKNLTEHKFFTQLDNIIQDYNSDEGIDNPVASVRHELERALELLSQVDDGMLDTASLEEVLEDEDKMGGLTWFSKGMNELIHTVLKGRFIIVGATTDCGKTTFFLNNIVHFAKQLQEGEKIIWFNNEEKTSALRKRMLQSVLGIDEETLEKKYIKLDNDKNKVYNTTKLKSDIKKALGFDIDERVLFMNAHGANHVQVEQELKKYDVRIIVFDMLDHVKYLAADKHHLEVEEKYKWARNLAAIHNCTVFASSQVSYEGEGMREPPRSALKESKTGKQATCDLLLMLGMSPDQGDNEPLENTQATYRRYISAPKNKMANNRVKRQDRKYASDIVNLVPLYIEADTAKFIDQADY